MFVFYARAYNAQIFRTPTFPRYTCGCNLVASFYRGIKYFDVKRITTRVDLTR